MMVKFCYKKIQNIQYQPTFQTSKTKNKNALKTPGCLPNNRQNLSSNKNYQHTIKRTKCKKKDGGNCDSY